MRYLQTFFLVFLSVPIFANDHQQNIKTAADLLKNQQPEAAYELLKPIYDTTTASENVLFILGVSAKKMGKLTEARNYLEQLLQLKPDAHRAKLELAQIFRRLGNKNQAKKYLLAVKASNPPKQVIDNIDRFLQALEQENTPTKNWQLFTTIGWQYDTNANAGPDSETVSFFGLPFNLSDDAKPIEDQALAISAGGSYFTKLSDKLTWHSNLSAHWTAHEKLKILDSLVISGATGLSWQQNNQLLVGISLIGDFVKVGYKDDFYSASFGVAPYLRYAITKALAFNLHTTVSQRKYNHQRKRDADRWTLAPSFDYRFTPNTVIKAGYLMGQEEAELAYFTQNFWGFNGMVFHKFNYGISLSANATFLNTYYQGKQAAHNKRRHDKMLRTGINLSYHLNFIGSDISASYSYTDNKSNLNINQYDRHQLFLTFQKSI